MSSRYCIDFPIDKQKLVVRHFHRFNDGPQLCRIECGVRTVNFDLNTIKDPLPINIESTAEATRVPLSDFVIAYQHLMEPFIFPQVPTTATKVWVYNFRGRVGGKSIDHICCTTDIGLRRLRKEPKASLDTYFELLNRSSFRLA